MQKSIKFHDTQKQDYKSLSLFIYKDYTSQGWTINRLHHGVIKWNGNIFHVTGSFCGEFTGDQWIPLTKAVTQSFDVFFDLRLNKWWSKQFRHRWFETPSHSLWHHCNDKIKRDLNGHFLIKASALLDSWDGSTAMGLPSYRTISDWLKTCMRYLWHRLNAKHTALPFHVNSSDAGDRIFWLWGSIPCLLIPGF